MASPFFIRILFVILSLSVTFILRSADYYRFGPDSRSDFEACMLIDANGDGCQWQYSAIGPSLLYEGNDNAADEYLFLPPVAITDTGTYRLTVEVMRGLYPERLEIGFAPNHSPASVQLAATIDNAITEAYYSTVGGDWHCRAKGMYYPVLRIVSGAYGMELRVRNVQVHKVATGVRGLPLHLTPTAAEASDFSVIDADGDRRSWRYLNDSVCFVAPGSLSRQSDDWLLLPPFAVGKGNYAFSFSARAEGSVEECFEVRFGPDSVSPDKWPVAMVYGHQDATWRRWRALVSTEGDSALYRAAIRLTTAGGDGIRIREFTVEESADSLLTLPCEMRVDATFTGQGDEWIVMPAFRAPVYENTCAVWTVRGLGPRTPRFEIWHGTTEEPQYMTRLGSRAGFSNREARPMSTSFYCDNDQGRHFIAFHIIGAEGWSGGVIESLRLDSLRKPEAAAVLPYDFRVDSLLREPTFFGPVWVDNMEDMLGISVTATGRYGLSLATEPYMDSRHQVGMMTAADHVMHTEKFMAAPLDYGYHYLCLEPLDSVVLLNSLSVEHLSFGVGCPGMPAVEAQIIPSGRPIADIVVKLPSTLANGIEMWPDEGLSVQVRTELETEQLFGYPGDTLRLRLRVPEGESRVSAAASNWAGPGMESSTLVTPVMHDNPAPVKCLMALPDTDNRGALLRWKPDTIGLNGGYVSPDSMIYRVELLRDTSWTIVAASVVADSVAVRLPADADTEQRAQTWRVTGINSLGESLPVSVTTLLGKPLTLPVTEDYRGAIGGAMLPWTMLPELSDSVEVTITGGAAGADPSYPENRRLSITPSDSTATASLLLPAIDCGALAPMMRLRMKATCGAPAVVAELLNDHSVMPLDTIDLGAMEEGWYDLCLPLPSLPETASAVRLRAIWSQRTEKTPFEMSRYTAFSRHARELDINWSSLPDTLSIGDSERLRTTLLNIGTEPLKLESCLLEVADSIPLLSETPVADSVLMPGKTLALAWYYTPGAECYGKEVRLKLMASAPAIQEKELQAYRYAGAGSRPVVTDLAGALSASPPRLHLSWNAPVVKGDSVAVDDVYTVYCDLVAIVTVRGTREYTDTSLTLGTHVYHIVCGLPDTHNPFSNPYTAEVTADIMAVEGISAFEGVMRPADGGLLCIDMADTEVSLCRADGMWLKTVTVPAPRHLIPLEPGIYIVRTKGMAVKIAVR